MTSIQVDDGPRFAYPYCASTSSRQHGMVLSACRVVVSMSTLRPLAYHRRGWGWGRRDLSSCCVVTWLPRRRVRPRSSLPFSHRHIVSSSMSSRRRPCRQSASHRRRVVIGVGVALASSCWHCRHCGHHMNKCPDESDQNIEKNTN
jgi:hypothetical protein